MGLAHGGVDGLVLDHEGGLAQGLNMSAPEYREGGVPVLEAEDKELGRPEEDPGAVGHVS